MASKPKQLAIYGKGGIGKSTTTSNISAALAEAGYKVMQFGCGPQGGFNQYIERRQLHFHYSGAFKGKGKFDVHEAIFQGYGGIYCVEAGGPSPRSWVCGTGDESNGIYSTVYHRYPK